MTELDTTTQQLAAALPAPQPQAGPPSGFVFERSIPKPNPAAPIPQGQLSGLITSLVGRLNSYGVPFEYLDLGEPIVDGQLVEWEVVTTPQGVVGRAYIVDYTATPPELGGPGLRRLVVDVAGRAVVT